MAEKDIPTVRPDSEKAWYSRIAAESDPNNIVLNQGDIIKRCPRYAPFKRISKKRILTQAVYYDVVVLSQSCDLAKDEKTKCYDIENVVVCPVSTLTAYLKANITTYVPTEAELLSKYKKEDVTPNVILKVIKEKIASFKGNIVRGHYKKFYLLNKCEYEHFNNDYLIVEFSNEFTININELIKIASENGERVRLESPYTESLSQAYGLMYMRVAQPIVIDSKTFPKEKIREDIFEPLREKKIL